MNRIQQGVVVTRWLLNLTLTALLGYFSTYLVISFLQTLPLSMPQAKSESPVNLSNAPVVQTIDINPLLNAQLFGIAAAATSNNKQPPPDTQLKLQLHGVYYNVQTPSESFAMIAESGATAKRYKTGQAIANSTLQEVHPRWVILSRNGRLETLRFSSPEAKNGRVAIVNNSVATNNNNTVNSDLPPAKLLGQFQQKLVENPQSLLPLVRAVPANENGQFIGYKISQGKEPALFDKFGLQAGDVVTGVNGIALDSPLKGLTIIQQLAGASQLNLQLKRQNEPVNLYFNIEK